MSSELPSTSRTGQRWGPVPSWEEGLLGLHEPQNTSFESLAGGEQGVHMCEFLGSKWDG